MSFSTAAPAFLSTFYIVSFLIPYPLADGDVSFTILHAEPQLGPMSSFMPMTSYGDFETIAAGTEYIGVTPEWNSLKGCPPLQDGAAGSFLYSFWEYSHRKRVDIFCVEGYNVF